MSGATKAPPSRSCVYCPIDLSPLRFAAVGGQVDEIRGLRELIGGPGLTLVDCHLVIRDPTRVSWPNLTTPEAANCGQIARMAA